MLDNGKDQCSNDFRLVFAGGTDFDYMFVNITHPASLRNFLCACNLRIMCV